MHRDLIFCYYSDKINPVSSFSTKSDNLINIITKFEPVSIILNRSDFKEDWKEINKIYKDFSLSLVKRRLKIFVFWSPVNNKITKILFINPLYLTHLSYVLQIPAGHFLISYKFFLLLSSRRMEAQKCQRRVDQRLDNSSDSWSSHNR